MADVRDHWERVYTAKAETDLSWYRRHSDRSLDLVAAAAGLATPIVDIGGGASTLVDDLLARGFLDVTVLDVAEAALSKSKARLGVGTDKVSWIVADITTWQPARRYGVWHDRAVFHFLTADSDQTAYVAALRAGTAPGATVVMAAFAPDGPERCSGLPVQRYSPQALAGRLGPPFALIDAHRESHRTPWGAEQMFSYAVLRRMD
ncbi:MAG: class I SAM-dependent methyltransferase [Reyranella sp.]|nr:class I SAM-dependent methyltransferase [Reyranella sp.]